jgi:hypothetical protein
MHHPRSGVTWFTQTRRNAIGVRLPDGTIASRPLAPGSQPSWLAPAPQGEGVFASLRGARTVMKIPGDGALRDNSYCLARTIALTA